MPFPNALLESLCEQHAIDPSKNIELDKATALFRTALQLWLEGKVSTEELSSVSNFLLNKIGWENDLSGKLEYASELSYYIRTADDEQSGIMLNRFILSLKNWLKETQDISG